MKSLLASRGWFPATSGNLSRKLSGIGEPLVFAVTASGKDKTRLTPEDYLIVDKDCRPVEPTRLKPSSETAIHAEIYRRVPDAQAVLHVHTIYNNLISDIYFTEGGITFSHVELIKALGYWGDNDRVDLPIVDNPAAIPALTQLIGQRLNPQIPGILIRNHGIYAWGDYMFAARRHLEAFEFLFEYQYKRMLIQGAANRC
jgi:methylthioribulose-1-phosphate dehydratase